MHGDPCILCFQHCKREVKTFCFKLPKTCRLCGGDLETSELRIPPFRVPYPFISAKNVPCCVVIRPTTGNFLCNYRNSADLHIGVTSSEGVVYEFDKEGLLTGNNEDWVECLAVPVVAKCDNTWKEFWDYTLQVVSTQEKWDCSRYDEENHNCYTFVLTFLRTLQVKELKPSLQNKMRFCMDFIIPRTRGAAKYIALFRILQKDGVCVQC
ncbi:MKRN2 opposite strand protein-like [Tachypleus tridentatus]|uniref:MKRN2 opposite strand protein-like n=1 Tax=Tachypleus tridentatus TaxID=6853 RepID=UPI003FD42A6C